MVEDLDHPTLRFPVLNVESEYTTKVSLVDYSDAESEKEESLSPRDRSCLRSNFQSHTEHQERSRNPSVIRCLPQGTCADEKKSTSTAGNLFGMVKTSDLVADQCGL